MRTIHRTAARHKRTALRGAGAFLDAIERAQGIPQADQDRLETSLNMSIEAICKGAGGPSEFNDLLESITIARNSSERITDEQTRDVCFAVANEGMWALNRMRERYLKHGRLGFSATDLQAVRDAVGLHMQFVAHCTRGELVAALKQAQKDIGQERKAA